MDLVFVPEDSNAAGPTESAEKAQVEPEDTSQKSPAAQDSEDATEHEGKRISSVEVSLEDTKTLVLISYQSRSVKSSEEEKKEEEAVKDRDDLEVERAIDSISHDRALPLDFESAVPDNRGKEMETREALDSTSGSLQEKGQTTYEEVRQEIPPEVGDASVEAPVVAKTGEILDVLNTSAHNVSIPDVALTETEEMTHETMNSEVVQWKEDVSDDPCHVENKVNDPSTLTETAEELTLEAKHSELDQSKADDAVDPCPAETKVDDQSTHVQDTILSAPEVFVVVPPAKPAEEKILDLAAVELAEDEDLKSETTVLDQLLVKTDEGLNEENQNDSDEKADKEEVVTEVNQEDQVGKEADNQICEELEDPSQSPQEPFSKTEAQVLLEPLYEDSKIDPCEELEELLESPQDSLHQGENEVALEAPSVEINDEEPNDETVEEAIEPVEEELATESYKESEQMQEPVLDEKDHNQAKDGKEGISNSIELPSDVQEIPMEVQAPVQDVICLAQETSVPAVQFPGVKPADAQAEESNTTKTDLETNIMAVNEVQGEADDELAENQVVSGDSVVDFDEFHNENVSILSDASTVLVANQSSWEYPSMDVKSNKASANRVWSTIMLVWRFCAVLIALAGIGISVSTSPVAMDGLCAPVGLHKTLEFDELVSPGETSISLDAPWWAPEAMKPWAFSLVCGDDRERIQLTLSKANTRKKFFQLSVSALSKNDNEVVDRLMSYKGLSMVTVDSQSITSVLGRSKRESTVSAPWSRSLGLTE